MSEPPQKRRRTNSPEQRASSPLKQPPRRRPSFASPTKASLSRNYPNLLRPTPAKSPTPSRGKQARAFVLGETDTQPEKTKEGGEQRREERNVTPDAQRATGRASVASEEEEPELPTSSQKGLEEQDEPRRGVLFSSPSKRPPRIQGPVKQSPLKPRLAPVQAQHLARPAEGSPVDQHTRSLAEKKQPPDPEIESRKHEKARLQRQVKELEAQVTSCTEAISKEQQRAPDQTLRPAERADLSTFISNISGTETEEERPALVSSLLCSFLPFSGLSVPPPQAKRQEKPVPSHWPLEVADPMPYLEMFTSFKFSTQLGLPRGKVFPASTRVHQKHTIDIVGPQKLLTVQMSVVIDAMKEEMIDMHILRLSPWAERELGTFIRGKSSEMDLGNACWAIDSYWEIARKRAHFWHKCEEIFTHLIAGRTDEDTENNRPVVNAKSSARKISRKDLNRHLGRDTLVLQDKHVLLGLKWQINFDWTGEAASEVTVEPAVPRIWSESDTTGCFRKIPSTFTSLVQTKGVFQATRIMVALLFPQ